MLRRVFVTGGSGFVGSAVIDELLNRGDSVQALVHSKAIRGDDPRVHSVQADLLDREALAEGMRGCDAVVHLVGIIMEKPAKGLTFERIHYEGTKAVVDAVRSAGVRRYMHMSALGVRPDAVSEYHRTKHRAEEYVRSSGLDWTILRPSLIHGPQGEFMKTEVQWARGFRLPPFLFMPYFGAGFLGSRGAGKLQPVYVNDVARAFSDALQNPGTIGRMYSLGGPDQFTWPELHHTVAQAVIGKRRLVLPIPAWKARLLTRILPAAMLPFNRDQIIMSQEDNTCDLTAFRADFGWEPQPFAATLRSYVEQML